MRTTRYTSRFRRDYKRERAGRYRTTMDEALLEVVKLLADDKPLPPRNYDHPLGDNWKDHRDCTSSLTGFDLSQA